MSSGRSNLSTDILTIWQSPDRDLTKGIRNVVLIKSEGKDRVRTSAVKHDTDSKPTL